METGSALTFDVVHEPGTRRPLVRATAASWRGRSEVSIEHDMTIDEAEDMIAALREMLTQTEPTAQRRPRDSRARRPRTKSRR